MMHAMPDNRIDKTPHLNVGVMVWSPCLRLCVGTAPDDQLSSPANTSRVIALVITTTFLISTQITLHYMKQAIKSLLSLPPCLQKTSSL